jgi:hypothetical protein
MIRNQEISRQLQRLNSLIQRTESASSGDIEIQAHWAKYLCVLCAGMLENALKEIYADFVKNAASEPVANYVVAVLQRIQNPKTNRFIETARSFKPTWGDSLTQFVDQNGRREAIDSIMNNRNQIAHGQSSGITLSRVKAYLKLAVEVLEYIENQCNPKI